LAVIGTIAACGGQTADSGSNPGADSGATNTGGGDGGVVTTGDAGAHTDATAGDDSGSDTYPAPHHPLPMLKQLGGPIIASVKIITVTYTGEAQRDAMRTFDDAIVHSPWWTTVTQGTGAGPGTSGGYVELDPTPVANKTLDNEADLKPYLRSLVAAGTLPPPDANTLYAMYFPASTTITLDGSQSCQAFGAYHDSTTFPLEAGTLEAAFAVMPNCGGGFTVSASHEFIEAVTDPHPISMTEWYAYNDAWFGAGGGEIADLCEGRGSTTDSSGTDLAMAWVNASAAASHDPCQPAADPSLIFYSAAVDTNEVFTMHDPTGGPDYQSEGFISVAQGATKTVPVDVFSEAKLPHDLQIVAGKRGRGSDPTMVGTIAQGVTAKLSQPTGRNGTKLTLTLTTDATTPKGDYTFVVRAILSPTDYHSWPVILRVL
jgi:hypothetical protein